jgi:Spy/CpxP family protein refolding chaperone
VIRALLIVLLGLAAGAAAFYGIKEQRHAHVVSHSHDAHSRLPELAWLRKKLNLTDPQFAAVAAAHEAYRPTCEALCMRVMKSHEKIKQLATASQPVSPELEEALKEHALLHVECQKAMLNHLHKTASLMTPEQAQTYLDALLPEIIELPLEPGGEAHHP